MNVFGITQKSISFFLDMFYQRNDNENGIRKFVEVEYKPYDREWAFEKFKAEKLKKVA
jgi:hypothetical protein